MMTRCTRDAGAAARAVIGEMRTLHASLQKAPALAGVAAVFSEAVEALERSVEYVVSQYGSEFKQVSVGAVPLLKASRKPFPSLGKAPERDHRGTGCQSASRSARLSIDSAVTLSAL